MRLEFWTDLGLNLRCYSVSMGLRAASLASPRFTLLIKHIIRVIRPEGSGRIVHQDQVLSTFARSILFRTYSNLKGSVFSLSLFNVCEA